MPAESAPPSAAPSTAPPNAGFVTSGALKTQTRLPVFTRRPQSGIKLSGDGPQVLDARYNDQILAIRNAGRLDSGIGFTPILVMEPIPGCALKPGEDSGKPDIGRPDREFVYRLFQIASRTPAIHARQAVDPELDTSTFVPHPQDPEKRVYERVERVGDVLPVVLSPREAQPKLATAKYNEVAASLSNTGGQQLLSAQHSEAARALGCASGRAIGTPRNSAFRTLTTTELVPAAQSEAIVAPSANIQGQHAVWCKFLSAQPRRLDLRRSNTPPAAFKIPAFAAIQKVSEEKGYQPSDPSYHMQPMALSCRAVAPRSAVAKYPEIAPAILRQATDRELHSARHSEALAAWGVALEREFAALSKVGFRKLATVEFAPPAGVSETFVRSTAISDQTFFNTALRLAARNVDFRTGKALVTAFTTPAFAPLQKESVPTRCELSNAVHDVSKSGMIPRGVGYKLAAAKYPEILPANLPNRSLLQPQVAPRAAAQQTLGAAVAWAEPTLRNAAFRSLAVVQSLPCEQKTLAAELWAVTDQGLSRSVVMSRREVQRAPATAKYPESVKQPAPHFTAPQSVSSRYAKARGALASAFDRAKATLPNVAFQPLSTFRSTSATPSKAASAPCVNSPYRKFSCRALEVGFRKFSFSGAPKVKLSAPAIAPYPQQPAFRVYEWSDLARPLLPMALPHREAQRKSVTARYQESVPAALPRLTDQLPQVASVLAPLEELGIASGRTFAALANSAFRVLTTWDRLSAPRAAAVKLKAAEMLAKAAAVQCAKLPDEAVLCEALSTEPRTFNFNVGKPLATAFPPPVLAPYFETSQPRACELSDTTYNMRSLALPHREVQRKRAAAKIPQVIPASLAYRAGQEPLQDRFTDRPRAQAAVVGRAMPAMRNSAFEKLAIVLPNSPVIQRRSAMAELADTAEIALRAEARELQKIAAGATVWQTPMATLGADSKLLDLEFELGELDNAIVCPSRRVAALRTARPSFDRFIRLPELSGLRAAADVARMADWTRAAVERDPAALIWQRPREAALPVQFLSSIALRDLPVTKGKWSVSMVDEVRVHPQPAPTMSTPVDERPRPGTRPTPGLKWVASKVPWIPM